MRFRGFPLQTLVKIAKKKMLKVTVFLLFALATVSLSFPTGLESDDEVERGDAYVDKLLYTMFEDSEEEYDPYEMEDSSVGFHRKIAFVNVTGEAKLYDGSIKGLRTLHRSDHCSLREEGDRLYVTANLGAGVLDFHYAGTVKFMNYGPTVYVEGELAYVEVFMEFSVDSKTGREGELHKFVIDDMRGMEVRISGLGPLNWALNPIINGVSKLFKGFVRNFLENKVRRHVAEYLPNFQFPVEGVTTEEYTTTTKEPIDETEAPETEEPIEETEVPETEAPQTENPVEETEAPETENPVEETETPETENPVEETETPETENPDEETEVPETENPIEETEEPESGELFE